MMHTIPGYKHQLDAYLGQQCIGALGITETGELGFTYHLTWQQQGYAISPHLPLDNSAAHSALSAKVFFQNLLPEGENLQILSERFHISRHNIFALTQLLGLDLSGALRVILHPQSLPDKSEFLKMSEDELTERLAQDDAQNLMIWEGKPRLSLAGVHQKINVHINQKNEMGFAEGKLCSTHILKFQHGKTQQLVLNEFLMMRLAKLIGLCVAEVSLKYFGDYPALLVKRFDRMLQGDVVKRRHIIDGCQALNLLPEYKYERHLGSGKDVKHLRDGASLPALFAFCETCKDPALAKKQLLEWALFNLIIGNLDAHGKNISFYVSQAGIELAPAYDLLCVRIYPEFSQELAMAIGDEFEVDEIYAYQLADFAQSCQLPRAFVVDTLKKLCLNIQKALPDLENLADTVVDNNLADSVVKIIKAQIQHLNTQAERVASVLLD